MTDKLTPAAQFAQEKITAALHDLDQIKAYLEKQKANSTITWAAAGTLGHINDSVSEVADMIYGRGEYAGHPHPSQL